MTTNPPKIFAFILILVMDESIWGQGRGREGKERRKLFNPDEECKINDRSFLPEVLRSDQS